MTLNGGSVMCLMSVWIRVHHAPLLSSKHTGRVPVQHFSTQRLGDNARGQPGEFSRFNVYQLISSDEITSGFMAEYRNKIQVIQIIKSINLLRA